MGQRDSTCRGRGSLYSFSLRVRRPQPNREDRSPHRMNGNSHQNGWLPLTPYLLSSSISRDFVQHRGCFPRHFQRHLTSLDPGRRCLEDQHRLPLHLSLTDLPGLACKHYGKYRCGRRACPIYWVLPILMGRRRTSVSYEAGSFHCPRGWERL